MDGACDAAVWLVGVRSFIFGGEGTGGSFTRVGIVSGESFVLVCRHHINININSSVNINIT